MTTLTQCLACDGGRLKVVADLGRIPVLTGALFDTREQARNAVSGHFELAACLDCGHAQNVAFDASLVQYDVSYDNSLHFSGTFQQYADELVERLVASYDIRDRHIVEIGSGKGDFLGALCRAGSSTGRGYDPTTEAESDVPGVDLIRDYYRPGVHTDRYDVLVCRHVLEHLDSPATLLRSLAASAPPHAIFYFEVPSAEFNFGPDGLWDCIYPHVSYFSEQSLTRLLHGCGFTVLRQERSFFGQFWSVEAQVGDARGSTYPDHQAHVTVIEEFADRYRESVAQWQEALAADDGRAAVWGAGSKGVNFVRAVDTDATLMAIDINPRKAGKFLPGSGHQIRTPDALLDFRPATVVITNSAYRGEIETWLAEHGLEALVSVV